jgi:adenylate cyclase
MATRASVNPPIDRPLDPDLLPDSGPDEAREKRVLAAYLRAEFQAPAAAMVDLIALAIEDAKAAGLSAYYEDLAQMRASAAQFSSRIAEQFTESGPRLEMANRAASAALRHDLRTPVTAIIGYAELLAEEAREHRHAAILPPLAEILTASKHLLESIDRLLDYTRSSPFEGSSAADSVLSQARDAVRHLVDDETRERAPMVGRILVIDDNVTILEALSRRLTRQHHQVVSCESGEEAIEVVRNQMFDVVLLDVMMPGMSGIEVLRRLKADFPDLPVVMISALDETEMIVRCLEDGADDYLSKPVNGALLQARIASSLDRKFLRDREKAAQAKLRAEKKRSDKLIRNVLPDGIVGRLRRGEAVTADHFDNVTILFCDLVGFTRLTAAWHPARTLDLLNEIFSGFDELVVKYGLEKIKTIGDAYMVAGGLPEPRPDHAEAVAAMALEMPLVLAAASRNRTDLACRIGLNSGPAVAGIVGAKKFFYDVWGDTVNTASRMEASSLPGRVQVSKATRDAIAATFNLQKRGEIDIKGKGPMTTYFLLGRRGPGGNG